MLNKISTLKYKAVQILSLKCMVQLDKEWMIKLF